MKNSLLITLVVLVGASVASSAVAQSCWQYHNLKIDFRDFAPLAPEDYPDDYDFCGGAKIIGTLNGRYSWCFLWEEGVNSESIYGDGWGQIWAGKYYSWIETGKGTLQIREWSWYDDDFGVEVGFSKVISGTGAYEGAFGSLAWTPRFPNLGAMLPMEGYICTP